MRLCREPGVRGSVVEGVRKESDREKEGLLEIKEFRREKRVR